MGRLRADAVAAVDPSELFVAAARERHPGVDVRQAMAEQLPFDADEFDSALAQLVVHFMPEPVAGLREMSRVTRAGGVVAACVWDHAGGEGPLSVFWEAAHELHPDVMDESQLPGAREGHLAQLLGEAELPVVETTTAGFTRARFPVSVVFPRQRRRRDNNPHLNVTMRLSELPFKTTDAAVLQGF